MQGRKFPSNFNACSLQVLHPPTEGCRDRQARRLSRSPVLRATYTRPTTMTERTQTQRRRPKKRRRRRAPGTTPAQRAWLDSANFAAVRKAAARKGRAAQDATPRCGARRRTDGQPCQNPGLENGRCRIHGGRVPSGAAWHRPILPGPDAPPWKLEKKLRELARRAAKRAARIAAMTPEERARFEKHSHAMRPGTPAERAQRRRDREAAALLRRPRPERPPTEEQKLIAADITELEAELTALRGATN